MNYVKLFSLILLVSSANLFAADDSIPNWKKRLQQAGEVVVSKAQTHPGVTALGVMAVTAYAADNSIRESAKNIASKTYQAVSSELAKDPINGTLKLVALGGLAYKVVSYGAAKADDLGIYIISGALKTDIIDVKDATVAGYNSVIETIKEYPKTSAFVGIAAGAGLAYLGKKAYDKYNPDKEIITKEADAKEIIAKDFFMSLTPEQSGYVFKFANNGNNEIDLKTLLKDSVFKAMLTENQLNIVKSIL